MEPIDYETFDYKYYDQPSFATPEEALRKAMELRATDPNNFYRIIPLNAELTAFRIEAVPKVKVYTGFLSRLNERWAGILAKWKR